MCCCDGLLLAAHAKAEEARLAALADGRAGAQKLEHQDDAAVHKPIEPDHSVSRIFAALWLRLSGQRAGRLVSEAPQR